MNQLQLLSREQLIERCLELESQKDEEQLSHFQELEEMENELTAAEVELHREHAISNSLEDRLTQLREEQASEHVEQEARNRNLVKMNEDLKEQVGSLQKLLRHYQDKVERLKSANRVMASQLEMQSEKLEELEERQEMGKDDWEEEATGLGDQMAELAQVEASALLSSKSLAKREETLQHSLQAALRLQEQHQVDRDEVARASSEGLAELERKLAALETLRSTLRTDRDNVAKQRQKVKTLLEQGHDVREERAQLDRLRTQLEIHTNAMAEIFEHRHQRARTHHFAAIRASIRFAGLDRRRRSSMNVEQICQVLNDLSHDGTPTSATPAPVSTQSHHHRVLSLSVSPIPGSPVDLDTPVSRKLLFMEREDLSNHNNHHNNNNNNSNPFPSSASSLASPVSSTYSEAPYFRTEFIPASAHSYRAAATTTACFSPSKSSTSSSFVAEQTRSLHFPSDSNNNNNNNNNNNVQSEASLEVTHRVSIQYREAMSSSPRSACSVSSSFTSSSHERRNPSTVFEAALSHNASASFERSIKQQLATVPLCMHVHSPSSAGSACPSSSQEGFFPSHSSSLESGAPRVSARAEIPSPPARARMPLSPFGAETIMFPALPPVANSTLSSESHVSSASLPSTSSSFSSPPTSSSLPPQIVLPSPGVAIPSRPSRVPVRSHHFEGSPPRSFGALPHVVGSPSQGPNGTRPHAVGSPHIATAGVPSRPVAVEPHSGTKPTPDAPAASPYRSHEIANEQRAHAQVTQFTGGLPLAPPRPVPLQQSPSLSLPPSPNPPSLFSSPSISSLSTPFSLPPAASSISSESRSFVETPLSSSSSRLQLPQEGRGLKSCTPLSPSSFPPLPSQSSFSTTPSHSSPLPSPPPPSPPPPSPMPSSPASPPTESRATSYSPLAKVNPASSLSPPPPLPLGRRASLSDVPPPPLTPNPRRHSLPPPPPRNNNNSSNNNSNNNTSNNDNNTQQAASFPPLSYAAATGAVSPITPLSSLSSPLAAERGRAVRVCDM